jgi:hypothetical protein
VLDPATGRTTTRLLPGFETISYGDLWARVRAIVAAWRRDETGPVNPGDFVATVGFAGPDYLTVDLVCANLGLVSVPLQHGPRYRYSSRSLTRSSRGCSPRAEHIWIWPSNPLCRVRRCAIWWYSTTSRRSTTTGRTSNVPAGASRRRHAGRRKHAGRGHPAWSGTSARAALHRRHRPAARDDPLHIGQHRDTEGRDDHRTDAGQAVHDIAD